MLIIYDLINHLERSDENRNLLRARIYNKTGEREEARKATDEIQEYNRKFGEMRGGSIFEQGFRDSFTKPF